MTRFLLVLMVAFIFPACAELDFGTQTETVASSDPFQTDPFFLDHLLAWHGERYGTLGPTGDRLYVDELLPGPGFQGRFGYVHPTDQITDLIRYEFIAPGGSASPEQVSAVWRPSHKVTSFRLKDVHVKEAKFITAENAAVSILTFENRSDDDSSFGVRVQSEAAQTAAFRRENMLPVDLSILANVPLPGELSASLRPGLIEVGGISFLLLDDAKNGGRSVLGLREGTGGPARNILPRALEIPVNQKARRLHFLGQVGSASGRIPVGALVGRYQVYYEEGLPLTQELRFGVNVADLGWTGELDGTRGADGRFVLTVPVNSNRRVRFVRFETKDQPFAPMLLALSLESAERVDSDSALADRHMLSGREVTSCLLGEISDPSTGRAPLRILSWNRKQMRLEGAFHVPAGGTVTLKVVHALAGSTAIAFNNALRIATAADPLEAHRIAYHSWFDENCSRFLSGDPELDALWWYRWFVVRHNMARPGLEKNSGLVFHEGRHGNLPERRTARFTPHVVAETRWLKDGSYARNQIRAQLEAADEPPFPGLARAALDLEQIHPDRAFLAEIAPSLERTVRALLSQLDPDGDLLLAEQDPPSAEIRPSAYFFGGFDQTLEAATLERPDLAAILYGDARALEQIHRLLGRPEAALEMAELAEQVQTAAVEKLWNPRDSFFYSAREGDDLQAICPEIIAFYPFATGLAPDDFEFARSFQHLLSDLEFSTPVPFASCSTQSPAFSSASETGVEPPSWSGPMHPSANSTVAHALGELLLEKEHHDLRPGDLEDFLKKYARSHFEQGDLSRPMVRESVDALTGKQSGCPDHLGSSWIDLVFRYHELLGWPEPTMP